MSAHRLRPVAWIPAIGLMALWLVILSHGAWADVLNGWMPGTDPYMRLERVRRLMEGAGWFDGTIPRSNAPFGEALHWSRPFDVLIVLATVLVRPFTSDPLVAVAAVLPPALLVITSVATAWMVRPLLPALALPLAALFALGQPVFLGYGMPGRADHHIFIVLLAVLMFGAVVRLLLRSDGRAAGWGGIAAGSLVWVSVEGLLPLAMATIALALPWLGREPGRWRAINLRFHGAATLVMAAALIVERPPAGWTSVYLDRISSIHLVLGLGMAGFWLLGAPLGRARNVGARTGIAGAAALVLALALAALDSRFFLGPFASLDPGLVEPWLPRIREVRPPEGAARTIYYTAAPVTALLLAPLLLRAGTRGERAARLTLALVIAVTLTLGLDQVRWLMYTGVFAAALLAVAVSDVAAALEGSRHQAWVRGALSVVAFVGWTVLGGLILEPAPRSGAACTNREVVHAVRDLPPAVIATHVDLGPALVFHTHHSVIAAPYLRNSGNRAVIEALNATRPSAGREILESRTTDLVVVCTRPRDDFWVRERDGIETLFGGLVRGAPPSWLEPVEVPGDSAGVLVYRLVR